MFLPCISLTQLDLSGNPAAEEDNYRERVYWRLPSIQVFDKHVVNSVDRKKAAKFMRSDEAKRKDAEKISERRRARSSAWKLSGCALILEEEVARIRRKEDEMERQRLLDLYSQQMKSDGEAAPSDCPLPNSLDFVSINAARRFTELSEWDRRNLWELFKEHGSDSVASSKCLSIVDGMADFGECFC